MAPPYGLPSISPSPLEGEGWGEGDEELATEHTEVTEIKKRQQPLCTL